ncbi:lipopolysaccharide assembly protein LapA domain-containing protein [Pseudomonas huanghezhanensis]|uniref:lipopolysaccharide assembly protein LapA domain-containing protein n=1 Tax=Pseudomonas huanghezhanensis TaxID=3002903 RepID=UPI0022861710|nr:lipopolysaccharide assembly protein LapA domain-containing protein [Pseudomonas sp. BSw22131]
MRNLKRLIFFVIVLLIALVTVVFTLENQQSVSLVFFGWAAPQISVAVPMILSLLVGMMIGPMLAFIGRLRKKPKSARAA